MPKPFVCPNVDLRREAVTPEYTGTQSGLNQDSRPVLERLGRPLGVVQGADGGASTQFSKSLSVPETKALVSYIGSQPRLVSLQSLEFPLGVQVAP